MTEETTKGSGIVIYHFKPGERARVFWKRYAVSYRTPMWCHGYECSIVKENKYSVSVKIDGYEDETYYIDFKDLVPVGYHGGTLA